MNTGNKRQDERSRANLKDVDPNLRQVFIRLAEFADCPQFIITEGLRSLERQQKLFLAKASKCDGVIKVSKHQLGRALDVVMWTGGRVDYSWPALTRFAKLVKSTAKELGVGLTWGGDWLRFRDGPHFELKG